MTYDPIMEHKPLCLEPDCNNLANVDYVDGELITDALCMTCRLKLRIKRAEAALHAAVGAWVNQEEIQP